MPAIERSLVAFSLLFLKKDTIFVTKTPRQILFDGYNDPLLDAASKLADLGIKLPGITSKFGLFFGRNDTWYADGINTIHTGVNGLGELGRIVSMNYSTTNPAQDFSGKCAKYTGSPELFPPYIDGTEKQYVFNNDLCRSLELTPTGESEKIHGTEGIQFIMAESMFANYSVNKDNKCYGEHEMPSGMFNASSCRFGAPIYMSQPHFYQTDPFYFQFLNQSSPPLKPDEKKHGTKFVFEPVSGVPLDVKARFQVNIKIDRIKEMPQFKNLPNTLFVPFFWSEMLMEMPENLAGQMWYLSNLKIILIITGGVLIGLGCGLTIYGYFHYMTSLRGETYAKVTDPNIASTEANNQPESAQEEQEEIVNSDTEVTNT